MDRLEEWLAVNKLLAKPILKIPTKAGKGHNGPPTM
jgi:hypothetical protein